MKKILFIMLLLPLLATSQNGSNIWRRGFGLYPANLKDSFNIGSFTGIAKFSVSGGNSFFTDSLKAQQITLNQSMFLTGAGGASLYLAPTATATANSQQFSSIRAIAPVISNPGSFINLVPYAIEAQGNTLTTGTIRTSSGLFSNTLDRNSSAQAFYINKGGSTAGISAIDALTIWQRSTALAATARTSTYQVDSLTLAANLITSRYDLYRVAPYINTNGFTGNFGGFALIAPDASLVGVTNFPAYYTDINAAKGFAFQAVGTAPVSFSGSIINSGAQPASTTTDTAFVMSNRSSGAAQGTQTFLNKQLALNWLGVLPSSTDSGNVKTTGTQNIYGTKTFTAGTTTFQNIIGSVVTANDAVQSPQILATGASGKLFLTNGGNGVSHRLGSGTPTSEVFVDWRPNKGGTGALLSDITDSLNARAADPMNGALPPVTVTDANYTMSAPSFAVLPTPTANRTVTLPNAVTYGGRILIIWNRNTSGANGWTFASTVWDKSGNTIVNLTTTTFYRLISDGTRWVIFP